MHEFKFMQPVKMSAEGQRQFSGSAKNGIYGIVLGFCKNDWCIRIRKIGRRSIVGWAKDFWEPCDEAETEMVHSLNR